MVNRNGQRNTSLTALVIAMAAGVFIIGGCGSTQQMNRWTDPSYNAGPAKKILVIAMRKDQLLRRIWEDAIVTAIGDDKQGGTVAIASYQLFANDLPDTSAMRMRAKEEGFDGVLLVARVQRDTLTNDVPGYTTNEQVTTYSQRWNAYVTRYEDVYHPGYSETETTVSVRTDLLIPQEDGKLVWSVTSRLVDPTSADQFRNAVAGRVVSELRKERLIH
jgi:hypothetical protein